MHNWGKRIFSNRQLEIKSLLQDYNDKGARIVNFATSKNLVVKSTMFPHRNIHKYTSNSIAGKTRNNIDHILIDRQGHSIIINVRLMCY
jgi:hypothetical protein